MYKENTLIKSVGNTPIVYLPNFSKEYNVNIFLKLEAKNPGGSIKDRVAFRMIANAIKEGKISANGTLIEPTSGNTGIGLALFARFFDLNTILVMPESMSLERRKLLQAYGAKLVLTPAKEGMKGAIEKAIELAKLTENSFLPDQFSNQACVDAHYETTAVEIDNYFTKNNLKLNAFFAGVGTGATISGIGKYYKEKYNNSTQIIALEPSTSAVLSGNAAGSHGIQGIGAGFVPKNFHREVVDNIKQISTETAIEYAKKLMQIEGISCGISTGANIAGLLEYAKENSNKSTSQELNLLTIACDSVDKYLSTALCE